MDSWLSAAVTFFVAGILAVAFALDQLARRRPDIQWLRALRLPTRPISEAQRRRERQSNRHAALEIIFLGLAAPVAYAALTSLLFNHVSTVAVALIGAASLACLAVGAVMLTRNRER